MIDSLVRLLEEKEEEGKDNLIDLMIKLVEDTKNGFNSLFN